MLFAPGRIWDGERVVVVASGPSLSLKQARQIAIAHDKGRCNVIAVSDAIWPCWFADILYSGDAKWWDHHAGVMSFSRVKVSRTQLGRYCTQHLREFERMDGYDPEPGNLRYGPNSGHQAVHLAAQLGAGEIIIAGIDFSDDGARDHYHGRHDGRMDMHSDTMKWREKFRILTDDLERHGVSVVNASLSSTIKWLPTVSLETRL